jgi:pimeloyl-ACP methyl ester carboxylesterase
MPGTTASLSFSDVHLSNGVRLRYAEQGDPAGEAVILLHGYSDSWFTWSRVLPLLSSRRRAIALDLRGHGDSDRPSRGYAMRELAGDVVAFMAAKRIARAAVVGHSMGSFVAQQVALAAPRRVSRLVLVASGTAPARFNDMLELQRAVNGLPDTVPEAFIREFQNSTIHRSVPEVFLERVISESRKLPTLVWREAMSGMLATGRPERLRAQDIPTLILWGDRDAMTSRAEQEALTRLVGGELKVYDETGHSPHWERPEEFAADLEEFLG